jgi:hypothetical protein
MSPEWASRGYFSAKTAAVKFRCRRGKIKIFEKEKTSFTGGSITALMSAVYDECC